MYNTFGTPFNTWYYNDTLCPTKSDIVTQAQNSGYTVTFANTYEDSQLVRLSDMTVASAQSNYVYIGFYVDLSTTTTYLGSTFVFSTPLLKFASSTATTPNGQEASLQNVSVPSLPNKDGYCAVPYVYEVSDTDIYYGVMSQAAYTVPSTYTFGEGSYAVTYNVAKQTQGITKVKPGYAPTGSQNWYELSNAIIFKLTLTKN